jgi:hypothetical protein
MAGRVNIGESTKGCNRNLMTLSHLNYGGQIEIKLYGDRLNAFWVYREVLPAIDLGSF